MKNKPSAYMMVFIGYVGAMIMLMFMILFYA